MKAKQNFADNCVSNVSRLLMVVDILLSKQLKRSVIVSNKLVYISCIKSCQTTYDLRCHEIRKLANIKKPSKFHRIHCLLFRLPPKTKILTVLLKIS